jgi:hypothetical protein
MKLAASEVTSTGVIMATYEFARPSFFNER